MPRKVTPFWACVTAHAEKHGISKTMAKPAVERFWGKLCEREREKYRRLASKINLGQWPPTLRRIDRMLPEAEQPMEALAGPEQAIDAIVIEDDVPEQRDNPAPQQDMEPTEEEEPEPEQEVQPAEVLKLDFTLSNLRERLLQADIDEVSDYDDFDIEPSNP